MKRAPLVALAAIGVFLATIAASRRELAPREDAPEPIDFAGVHTLVIVVPNAEVTLAGGNDGHYSIRSGEAARIERNGAVLTLRADGAPRYAHAEVRAPATLRRIALQSGEIHAQAAVGALEVVAAGALAWQGDARALRLVDNGAPPSTCSYGCKRKFRVDGGAIAALTVRASHGTVQLADYETIGQATLELGEEVEYELGGLHGPPRPAILRAYDMPSTAPAMKTTPAETPPEPPRAD